MKIVGSIVGIILVAGVLWLYGQERAEAPPVPAATLERLVLVWPRFDSMSDRDRLILVRLAEACQLAAGPKLRDDTIVCLRWAAAQDDPELWAGIPMDEAQARLEALLQDAGEA